MRSQLYSSIFHCCAGIGAVSGAIRSKAMSLIGGKSSDGDAMITEEETYPDPPSHAVVSLLVKGV